MSRALVIDADQEVVRSSCAEQDAPISVIETLPGGFTRVVLKNGDAAATIGRAFKGKIITDPVKRTPLTTFSRQVPSTPTLNGREAPFSPVERDRFPATPKRK